MQLGIRVLWTSVMHTENGEGALIVLAHEAGLVATLSRPWYGVGI